MQFKVCDGALTLQESDVSSSTLVKIKVGVWIEKRFTVRTSNSDSMSSVYSSFIKEVN